MKRFKNIITIICVILTISANSVVVIAQTSTHPPAFPSSFYGVIDEASVTENSVVKVWIGSQLIASSLVQTYGADLVYSIRIPADDPSTPDIIEGGKDGDVLTFTVDEQTDRLNEDGYWQGGTNIRLDLTMGEPNPDKKIYLPLIVN